MSSFRPLRNAPSFQRWAAAQWRRPADPSIYGSTRIDATACLEMIEQLRAEWGIRLTITHVVSKALAVAIARHPEVNVKVRFWGRLERRETVDLTVLVASETGDLSAHRLAAADRMPLRELATELIEAAGRIRRDEDPQFQKSRDLITRLPWWLMRPFLTAMSLFMNELHVDLSSQGLPVDLFGTAMVTSMGMHGVDEAYPPLTPIGRIAVDLLIPRIKDDVWVEDGELRIHPTLKLCGTFDHRVVDGVQAARLCQELQGLLAEPRSLL